MDGRDRLVIRGSQDFVSAHDWQLIVIIDTTMTTSIITNRARPAGVFSWKVTGMLKQFVVLPYLYHCTYAHTASTLFFHLVLTIGLSSCSSMFTIQDHVVLGLPTFLFPSGCQVNAIMQWWLWSFLSMYPIQLSSFLYFHQLIS